MEIKERILYLSYDGMTDPLGQGQVLNYLRRLAQKGFQISLVSFEKPDRFADGAAEIRAICEQAGIDWQPLSYTKKPPVISTLYDIFRMWKKVRKIHRLRPCALVHCRGYISALVGLRAKRRLGMKFIFDMRGFWIDEKIESGEWDPARLPYSIVVRYLRKKEKKFYAQSDAIVTLTHAARQYLLVKESVPEQKVTVIPTCVDLTQFPPYQPAVRDAVRADLGIPANAFVLLYSGGVGGNYDTAFLMDIFRKIRNARPQAHLLILTKDGRSLLVHDELNSFIHVRSLPFKEVAGHLYAGDLGVINYRNEFSVAGRSPTKLGEYWATGLPAIAPQGIGDLPALFAKYAGAGIEYHTGTWEKDLDQLMAQRDTHQLRNYSEDYFSLDMGVERYHTLYKQLGVVLPRIQK